ncbi:hypothetical protein [Rubrivivax sp. JA1026]|uniref:hypothetical protein n=1 Tax=Rubrivivax sp. JA1026 TaxID=2710888 RepID=UPI0013E92A62|nr:hypothetical protein [Rubrivivax sp. JA1026]
MTKQARIAFMLAACVWATAVPADGRRTSPPRPRQAASPSRDEPFYAAYARDARELTPPQRAQLIVKPDAMAEQAGGRFAQADVARRRQQELLLLKERKRPAYALIVAALGSLRGRRRTSSCCATAPARRCGRPMRRRWR